MSAFVIFAAGRGSRVGRAGEHLHKALLPLGGKAIISHHLELAPPDSKIIVCVGHRAHQIEDYIKLAHPSRQVHFVQVTRWDEPGIGGPGESLSQARDLVGNEDMFFSSCDTLWAKDMHLWGDRDRSWSAVAPIPSGTDPKSWCIMLPDKNDVVTEILDKTASLVTPEWKAYTGLSHIASEHLDLFWNGVSISANVQDEKQVTGGLISLSEFSVLDSKSIDWTDVGDEASYRRAVARFDGYDWTKLDQATYVLPEEGRVVKFASDPKVIERRTARQWNLASCTPPQVELGSLSHQLMSLEYVTGVTGYGALEDWIGRTRDVIAWAQKDIWTPVDVPRSLAYDACLEFYKNKTMKRISMIQDDGLRNAAAEAVAETVDFHDLCGGSITTVIHGDFNFGNMIYNDFRDKWTAIDWREDFGGEMEWGDKRWDLGKLLAGTQVHWDNARAGSFRPWKHGEIAAEIIRELPEVDRDVEIIGALSLLNSAPLHAAPLDEILIARGLSWLERVV